MAVFLLPQRFFAFIGLIYECVLRGQAVRYIITRLVLSKAPPIISVNQCTPEISLAVVINTVNEVNVKVIH